MGVFGRFERKIEGAVNGVFARAFKGDVQPVEIAARLQRELDAEAKLMSRDRRLVPNEFAVGLSRHDYDRLAPYGKTLMGELLPELKSHAAAMGYVFNGPIMIHLDLNEELPTGRFTVDSEAVAGQEPEPKPAASSRTDAPRAPSPPTSRPDGQAAQTPGAAAQTHGAAAQIRGANAETATIGAPRLVIEVNGTRHRLEPPGLVIGRGSEADLRINDPGVSRRHAEIRVRVQGALLNVEIVDLGSTNGIVVNGHRVREAPLAEGSRIEIGNTRLLVHAPAGR